MLRAVPTPPSAARNPGLEAIRALVAEDFRAADERVRQELD